MKYAVSFLTLFALLCTVTVCGGCTLFDDTDSEPFSAAYTIRSTQANTGVSFPVPLDADALPTDVLPEDADVYDYDALRTLLDESLFGDKKDMAFLWRNRIACALDGAYTNEDDAALEELIRTLSQVSSFVGMQRAPIANADVCIVIADVTEPDFTYTADEAGHILSGQILLPATFSAKKRRSAMAQNLFHLLGFLYTADSTLPSVLNRGPADDLTHADLILLDAVYSDMTGGMSREMCLQIFAERYGTP